MRISPTPGRVVWYFPARADSLNKGRDMQPLAATVSHVNDDETVNLTVHSVTGDTVPRQNIPLLQPGDSRAFASLPDGHCEWMPYQVGQARGANAERDDVSAQRQQQEPPRPPVDATVAANASGTADNERTDPGNAPGGAEPPKAA